MIAPTSARPRNGRRRRGVRGVLVLCSALACVLVWPGLVERSAAAVEPEPQQVSITLEQVRPTALDRDSRLVLRGTATNTRDTPVTNLQLMLWRDQGTLYTEQAQVEDLVNAPSTLPVGARVQVETAYTTDLPASLPPGQSVEFELSATVTELGLPPGDGAALVGVQARENAVETVGRSRTLVPLTDQEHPAVPVTSVVLLGAPPARVRADVFTGEDLARELAPGGRLELLLASAERDDVSWAVDPLLLAEAADLADGYRVLVDGDETEGSLSEAAADWLTRYEELPVELGYRLPWGQPDLLALARSNDQELTEAVVQAQRGEDLGGAEGLPLLLAPAGGTVDPATMELAESMGPEVVLVRGAAGSGVIGQDAGTAVVDVDAAAFTPELGPDPRDSDAQVVQQLTSSTLLTSLGSELLDLTPPPQVRVVDTAELAALDAASTEDGTWQRRTGLPELLTSDLPPGAEVLDGAAADLDRQLTAPVLRAAGDLLADTRAVNGLLTDAGDATDADRLASAAVSSWWRPDAPGSGQQTWLAPQREELRDLLSGQGIVLRVSENVAMAGRSGQFPVSITNRLDRSVTVGVVFETDNQRRLNIPPVDAVEIAPGQTRSTTAEARARANGSFNAGARLATPAGEPFGPPREIRIEASEIGRAGWVIVIGSGLVLIGGTVLRVRQVRRQQGTGPARAGLARGPDHDVAQHPDADVAPRADGDTDLDREHDPGAGR